MNQPVDHEAGLIRSLELKSRLLDLDLDERKKTFAAFDQYLDGFLAALKSGPAFGARSGKSEGIIEADFPENPSDAGDLIALLKNHLDTEGINPASGGHLGYIPGGGIWPSALGDYIAAVTNKYAGVVFASPGAAMMEGMLVNWMANMFGLPCTAGGTLTSGGSVANLAAIVAARDAREIKSAVVTQTVAYMTEQVHHCIDKALRIAGLGEIIIRKVPMDEKFRMNISALRELVESDESNGLKPWLLVSSAGTTDTGAVDQTELAAEICQEHNLWLHVDAAYGGFFILCEEGKEILKGLNRADSIVVDPHKGLFLPYGTGAVIVKDRKDLYRSHAYQANYMQDALKFEDWSPADLSPELTRHFRGLRMWLPMKLLGISPFRAALSEKIFLARYFYRKIQEIPGMEVLGFPELSVVPFRMIPEEIDADEFNLRLIAEIHRDGRVFLSSTKIRNQVWLRVAILCFRTHLATIELCLSMIIECLAKTRKHFEN